MNNAQRLRLNKGQRIEIELLNKSKFDGQIGEVKEIEIRIEDYKKLEDFFILKNSRWGKIIKVDDIEGLKIYGEKLE